MRSILSRVASALGLAAITTAVAGAEAGVKTAELKVGSPLVVEAPSRDGKFGVVFEDDGDTGYLYALDFSDGDNPIQEAVAIYNVENVTDRDRPSHLRIVWSPDDRKAGLWINDHPHAVFDFAGRRGYSRMNFPQPLKWRTRNFTWSEEALSFFR